MKNTLLTTDQVREKINAKYPGVNFEVEVVKGIYIVRANNLEAVVIKKFVYQRHLETPVDKKEVAFEYNGNGYTRKSNKEDEDFLLVVCGFKSPKKEGPLTLKQKIENAPYALRYKVSITDTVRFINQICSYADNLLSSFSNVKIFYTINQDQFNHTIYTLRFKYYTGTGKNFKEGGGMLNLDELYDLVMIPEIETVAAKYGKKIIVNNLVKTLVEAA